MTIYSGFFQPIVLFWKNGLLPWLSVTSKGTSGAKQLRKKTNNVSLAAINTVPSDRLQLNTNGVCLLAQLLSRLGIAQHFTHCDDSCNLCACTAVTTVSASHHNQTSSCRPHCDYCVQVLFKLLKVVLYICTSVFFAGGVYAVATSASFWDVCADLGTLVGPLQTAMADGQAIFVTFAGLTFAGVCAMLHEVWHCLSTLEQAATPQPKLQRVQLIPQSDFRCGIALHLKSEYGNSCILCTYD